MNAVLEQKPVTLLPQLLLAWPLERNGAADNAGVVNGVRRNHVATSTPKIIVAWERDRWDMARLAGGDEQALASLMQRHATNLARHLERMVRNHSDAKELVNEAFIRVFQHRLDYNYESRFSTWLYVIASRLAINLLRWRGRHPEFLPLPEDAANNSSADLDALIDPALTPSEQAVSDEWTDALSEALAKLPEQLKGPLLLVALDGCSQAEVAARLGCTVKAVETRLYHGRKRLRSELENILSPWRFRVKAALRPQTAQETTPLPQPYEGCPPERRMNRPIMNSPTTARVLVVDDDPLNLRLMVRTLAHAGFATTSAANGAEAMDSINTARFVAVVSDVRMPRMSGIELLKTIRARFPWLPVILMTGQIEDDIREAASTWGAAALFQKPVNRADLVLAIRILPHEPASSIREFFPCAAAAACAEI